MLSLREVWKEAAETSIGAPMGRDAKRGEEAPSSVETGVGPGSRIGWESAFDFDVDESKEDITETGHGTGAEVRA